MIGNLATYAAELTSGESRTDVAVIFACDAFGLSLINNKIIPGRLADSLGCTVFIPDLLEGSLSRCFKSCRACGQCSG